jgi:hypothetical protein
MGIKHFGFSSGLEEIVFKLSPGPQRIKAWKPQLGTGVECTILSWEPRGQWWGWKSWDKFGRCGSEEAFRSGFDDQEKEEKDRMTRHCSYP